MPRFEDIIALWEDTLNKFIRRGLDGPGAASRLGNEADGNRAGNGRQRPELDWDSPEIKMIDHLYSSLDDDGLYQGLRGQRLCRATCYS